MRSAFLHTILTCYLLCTGYASSTDAIILPDTLLFRYLDSVLTNINGMYAIHIRGSFRRLIFKSKLMAYDYCITR